MKIFEPIGFNPVAYNGVSQPIRLAFDATALAGNSSDHSSSNFEESPKRAGLTSA